MRSELASAPKPRRTPLDVKGAAAYTGYEEGYLNKLRCKGGGPVYIKKFGTVRYDPDDLDAWLDAGKRRSTSEVTEAA